MATAGFRTALPFIAFSFGGGTLTPVAPLPTTPTGNRDLVSQLNIRAESQKVRGSGGFAKLDPQVVSHAFDAIQDHSNSTDDRLRRLSGNVNSLGLNRDPAGNITFAGATFTVRAANQVFRLFNDRMQFGVANTPPDDGEIPTGHVTVWVDDVANQLKFRVRYSDGTLKTGTVNLV